MKVWYDHLVIKEADDVPEVVHLFKEIDSSHLGSPDEVFTQIQDVTVRTHERNRKEIEVKFFNRKRLRFDCWYTKGVWLIDGDEDELKALAVGIYK